MPNKPSRLPPFLTLVAHPPALSALRKDKVISGRVVPPRNAGKDREVDVPVEAEDEDESVPEYIWVLAADDDVILEEMMIRQEYTEGINAILHWMKLAIQRNEEAEQREEETAEPPRKKRATGWRR